MTDAKNKFWGPVALAVLLTFGLILWMISGDVKTAREDVDERQKITSDGPVRVEVERYNATTYQPKVMIQGQIEPWRRVSISAQVEATVEALPVQQGQEVRAGDVLVKLSEEDRPAAVAQARARFRQLDAELKAAERLRSGNLVSESEKLRLESELSAAKAALEQAQLALRHVEPTAPFDGVVNQRNAELGEYVAKGQALLELVQVDRLKVAGNAPQQSVAGLKEGQLVSVELLDGRSLEGRLSFVSSAANSETRSFYVEAEVPNPDGLRVAGGSATLGISLSEQQAMFLSPAYLSLGDDGKLGVLHVDDADTVRFTTVRLLSATTDGAWITGLPVSVRLITQGGGFVAPGQTVTPVTGSSISPRSRAEG
ncbi:MAG: efflux RND transporter periplasmic adaptor subunit [Marinobacter sp.]|uniref:efflux RND transporter periplasmic adaptor subunit n=1 Tax=Marinobacter sp. TaxID=50741 RepID=UPI0034A08031